MKTIDEQVAMILRRRKNLERSIREGKKIRFTSDEVELIKKIRKEALNDTSLNTPPRDQEE